LSRTSSSLPFVFRSRTVFFFPPLRRTNGDRRVFSPPPFYADSLGEATVALSPSWIIMSRQSCFLGRPRKPFVIDNERNRVPRLPPISRIEGTPPEVWFFIFPPFLGRQKHLSLFSGGSRRSSFLEPRGSGAIFYLMEKRRGRPHALVPFLVLQRSPRQSFLSSGR